MKPEQAVTAQLRARGIDAAQIRFVVMTHLHATTRARSPSSPMRPSSSRSRSGRARGRAASRPTATCGASSTTASTTALFDFDAPEADSFATFGRSFDLFGDGSVRLVFTPGHTHGHMSVVLRLRDREVLLCGDAAYTMRDDRDRSLPCKMADEHLFRRSLREIQLYRSRRRAR